jgi:hypothetical protein
VTTARCPACGASVLDGAPWCTLCYADLRAPAATPAPEPAAQAPVAQQPAPGPAPLTSPAPAALPGTGVDLLDPALDAPVAAATHTAFGPATWPCTACGAAVELEHDACPVCTTPFLAGADPAAAVDIPLVGSLRPLTATKSSRVWLMIGGTVAVSVVLTVVLSLIGLLL